MRNWFLFGTFANCDDRDDEKRFFHLFRSSLPEGKDNVMCAVKLILILALRSGNVYGSTIDQVLEHTKARTDRTIQWRFPDRPVLCGSTATGGVLNWEQLALRQKGSRALVKANNILGSSQKITLHNLRFGAAEDLQVIHPHAAAGISLDAISNELGHTPVARLKGVGLIYAQAYSTEDHWARRVELQPEQLPFNKFVSATEPKAQASTEPTLDSLKRYRTRAQVTKDCELRGLDSTLPRNRQYRSRQLMGSTQTETGFLASQATEVPIDPNLDSMLDQPTTEPFSVQPPHPEEANNTSISFNAGSSLDLALGMDLVPVGENDDQETSFYEPVSDDLKAAWAAVQPAADDTTDEDVFANGILSLADLSPTEGDDEHDNEAIEVLLGDDDTAASTDTIAVWDESLLAAMTGPALEYVRRLSSVNLLRVENPKKSKRWAAATTAAKDPTTAVDKPSRFTFRCLNHAKGCDFDTATRLENIVRHLSTCAFEGPQADNGPSPDNKRVHQPEDDSDERGIQKKKKKKEKAFPCKEIDCDRAYVNRGELTAHYTEDHRPVHCFVAGCEDETTFLGEKKLLRDHIVPQHPALGRPHPSIADHSIAEFECPIDDSCKRKFRYFLSRSWSAVPFQGHARKDHDMTDAKEIKHLIPTFPGNPCFVPGCSSTQLFPVTAAGEKKYVRHLMDNHLITDAAERYEYLWKRVRGQILPMRPDADEEE